MVICLFIVLLAFFSRPAIFVCCLLILFVLVWPNYATSSFDLISFRPDLTVLPIENELSVKFDSSDDPFVFYRFPFLFADEAGETPPNRVPCL